MTQLKLTFVAMLPYGGVSSVAFDKVTCPPSRYLTEVPPALGEQSQCQIHKDFPNPCLAVGTIEIFFFFWRVRRHSAGKLAGQSAGVSE